MSLNHALLMGLSSQAAYPRYRETLGNLGFARATPFDYPSAEGYVASNAQHTVLAFRGSLAPHAAVDFVEWLKALADWIVTNADDSQRQWFEGYVHSGFLNALENAQKEIHALVKAHRDQGQQLWVTGHSLGGALAALAGHALTVSGNPVSAVVTFGAPRVGNEVFRASYPAPLYRFEQGNDIVPHLPPPPELNAILDWLGVDTSDLARYVHCGEIRYIDANGTLHTESPNAARIMNLIAAAFGDDRQSLLRHHDLASYLQTLAALGAVPGWS